MFMFLLLVLCVVYVIRDTQRIRRSRIYKVFCQYPPCLKELPIIGCNYHFLLRSPEDAIDKALEVGRNTIKQGGIARVYGYKTFYLAMTDAPDIAEILTKCLNKDKYLYSIVQVLTGNGSVFVPGIKIKKYVHVPAATAQSLFDPAAYGLETRGVNGLLKNSSHSKIRRRVIMPAFNSKMMSSYIDGIWAESVALTEELKPFVGKGPFTAGARLGAFCFNNIIRLADTQEIRKDLCTVQLLKDLHRILKLAFERCCQFWMHINFLYTFTANHKESKKLVSTFQHYCHRMRELRKKKLSSDQNQVTSDSDREKEKLKSSLIDCLISSQLTDTEIMEEILVMVAASEEAGQALGFALSLLGQYPAIQDKVYEELYDIFGDSDRPLEKDDLVRMRYLDMVIKETIRLYPPVPLIIRRAHKAIELSSGRVVPRNAGIVVPIISVHRNPKYWTDAEHFDPERFLPERIAAVPDGAYIPFSYGPRSCVGYKLASYMVKLSLCALLRKYKVVGEAAAGPVPYIPLKFEVTMKSADDCKIELVYRT